jgi:hypothetical protein
MKLLFCFSLIVFGMSCQSDFQKLKSNATFQKEALSQDCEDFIKKTIHKNWKVHRESTCYLWDDDLINQIRQKQGCFKGMSFDEIKKIFGEPSLNLKTKIAYKINETCINPKEVFQYLKFYGEFDTEIVRSVSVGEIEIIDN